jgi:hypothetical protein
VGSYLRLARRAPTAAEARACCARAIELKPFAVAPYLNWVRALVAGGK